MPQSHPFEQKLALSWPTEQWRGVTVLLAVSGGADSVALAHAMVALGRAGDATGSPQSRLRVAHFNHRLRGDASDGDERFVASLAQAWGLPCDVGHANVGPGNASAALSEEAARDARYDFLRQAAEQAGARYLVTAHTANDQAETVLHHLLRGTGLAGLAGIPRVRPLGEAVTLIRPLLNHTRAEVLAYLQDLGQPFREDATNQSADFTRNRLRHTLIPLLQRDYAPGVVESLRRLSSIAQDAQRVIDQLANQCADLVQLSRQDDRMVLDCQALATYDRHLIRETLVVLWRRQNWPLRDMGFDDWNQLADMVLADRSSASEHGKGHMYPGAILAQKKGEQLVLALVKK